MQWFYADLSRNTLLIKYHSGQHSTIKFGVKLWGTRAIGVGRASNSSSSTTIQLAQLESVQVRMLFVHFLRWCLNINLVILEQATLQEIRCSKGCFYIPMAKIWLYRGTSLHQELLSLEVSRDIRIHPAIAFADQSSTTSQWGLLILLSLTDLCLMSSSMHRKQYYPQDLRVSEGCM